MIAGKNAAEVAREIIQQAKFGGSGGNGLSANGQDHGGGVDSNLADCKRARGKRTLKAAQHGFHTGHEFARAKWFCNVVIGPEFQTEDAIRLAAFGGQKNYRHSSQARSLADGAAELKAILARNHDVEDKQRGALALGVG